MGVRFGPKFSTRGMAPEIACIIPIVDNVFNKLTLDTELTSGTDRTHGWGSFHYTGNAIDILWMRQWSNRHSPDKVKEMLFKDINGFPLTADIPPDYDVIWEVDSETVSHFHIEYQPKLTAEEYQKRIAYYLDE